MLLLPAIDIINGKVVRLTQGNYAESKTYADYPAEIALKWKDAGAKFLHLVDLDGAKAGEPKNLSAIKQIIKETGLPVEVGGGIRTKDNIKQLLEIGVTRVILGTTAIENRVLLRELLEEFSEYIYAGLDTRDGKPATRGWLESMDIDAIELASELQQDGVRGIICTDITKDGMMNGVNAELYRKLTETVNIPVIASGGVTTIDDLKTLSSIDAPNLEGAIIGKALYEGSIKLETAINLFQKEI